MKSDLDGQWTRRPAVAPARLARMLAGVVVCGAATASCASILGFEDGSLVTDGGGAGPGTGAEGGSDGPGGPGIDAGNGDGATQADALSSGDGAGGDAAGADASDAAFDGANEGGTTKQAFETPLTFNGRLDANGVAGAGGFAAGDARCNEAAQAMFPGRMFVAWLSSSATPAKTRLTAGASWYVGATLLGGITELTTGTLKTALNKGPDGSAVPAPLGVWTGTEGDGTENVGGTCSDWTTISSGVSGEIGSSGVSGTLWTYATIRTCDSTYHLYCFEK
jgi:hypothetical protein